VERDPSAALTSMGAPRNLSEIGGCLVLAYDALRRKSEADEVLTELEKSHADAAAYAIGRVYADRGQIDQAFKWFDRAYTQRDQDLLFLGVDPLLKNVQSDPRFEILLRKMGLLD
jgi:adenylate cyclase